MFIEEPVPHVERFSYAAHPFAFVSKKRLLSLVFVRAKINLIERDSRGMKERN